MPFSSAYMSSFELVTNLWYSSIINEITVYYCVCRTTHEQTVEDCKPLPDLMQDRTFTSHNLPHIVPGCILFSRVRFLCHAQHFAISCVKILQCQCILNS
uniref:Uncharacterized protein n=1 Tax=Arundo donax TaxID=35708 RepID=A0A0A9DU66_ARUDO